MAWTKSSPRDKASKTAWKKPEVREIKCGMEINMYGPGEDDERGSERDVI